MLEEKVRELLDAKLQGVGVEVCGTWIWCGGNTYPHRAWLKSAGFRWANKKAKWYWHDPNQKRSKGKAMSMDWIRWKHGSVVVTEEEVA